MFYLTLTHSLRTASFSLFVSLDPANSTREILNQTRQTKNAIARWLSWCTPAGSTRLSLLPCCMQHYAKYYVLMYVSFSFSFTSLFVLFDLWRIWYLEHWHGQCTTFSENKCFCAYTVESTMCWLNYIGYWRIIVFSRMLLCWAGGWLVFDKIHIEIHTNACLYSRRSLSPVVVLSVRVHLIWR